MTVPVLAALGGAPWEPHVVAALDRPYGQVRVVRRCVDLADLLATAPTGMARAALISTSLRRLDRDTVARLASAAVVPVGVVSPDDPAGESHLRALGVVHLVSPALADEALAQAISDAVSAGAGAAVSDWTYADPASVLATGGDLPDAHAAADSSQATAPSGRVLAVWGPTGAPGRTTLAAALAGELAAAGASVLLADVDVYGGTMAQQLGILGEPPGLPAAARLAAAGALDLAALDRLAPAVAPGLRLLGGISRAERWPELRPASLKEVWALSRQLTSFTVADCGFNLEQDEELSFDVAAPRRNGATLTTLESADEILAVGAADPVGIARLVRGLAQLHEAIPGALVRVVLNKVRRGPVGASPEKQLQAAMAQYAGAERTTMIPYDLRAADEALLTGRTWAECAPKAPARLAVAGIAAEYLQPVAPPARRGLLRRRAA